MSSNSAPRMPSSLQNDDSGDMAVNDYLARMDAGEVIDRDQFIAEHPESAEALRSFFASELLFRQLLAHGPSASASEKGGVSDPRALAIARQDEAIPWGVLPAAFGRYRVTKLIGRGAMGTVYRAHDTELDRSVALKIPHRSPDGSPLLRDRHLQEARSAARLRHPNICAVFDVGAIDGIDFIAMEYVEGWPLSDFLREDRRPPTATTVGLIRRLAMALQVAHAQGVIHRDLKPGNILVRKDGEPVLMDFGLALGPLAEGDERLSREGMMIGSPAYMAPEQARGEGATVGPATDIYGLGVVFYELLTGRLPFTGSVMTILAKILTEDPPSILLLRPETDRELVGICHRMLSKRPDDRFTSMEEVAEVLKDWLQSRRAKGAASAPQVSSAVTTPTLILKTLPPRKVAMLTQAAQRCLQQRDYTMAVKLLSEIPLSQHSEGSARTLHRAQDLAEEVDYLSLDIDEALAGQDYSGLETALKRFRELQPHNRRAQDLQRRLVRRGAVLTLEPATAERVSEVGFLREHARPLTIVAAGFVLLFLFLWQYTDRYLAEARLTVPVEVDDPAATIRVDQEVVSLDRGAAEIRLEPGSHQVEARLEGAAPQDFVFEVARGRPNRLQVTFHQPRQPVAAVLPPGPPVQRVQEADPPGSGDDPAIAIGMRLIRISAGEYLMGSPASEVGRELNEGPQRRISITEPFWAGAFEVTRGQYAQVMKDVVGDPAAPGNESDSERPIDNITWYDAIEFCNRLSQLESLAPAYRLTNVFRPETSIVRADVELANEDGYRLPTEEEWEYVCRAGTTTPFFFGSQCNGTQSNVNGTLPCGGAPPGPFLGRTCSVGQYPPNAFGLFDTHGNAAEWCWRSSQVRVSGQDTERGQPVRGGGPTNNARFARSAARQEVSPGTPMRNLGFRVVRGPLTVTPGTAVGAANTSSSPQPTAPPLRGSMQQPLIDFFTKKEIARYQGPPSFVPVYTVEQEGYHWLGQEYGSLMIHQKEPAGQNRFRLLGYAKSAPAEDHQRYFRYLFLSKDHTIWRWRYSLQSRSPEPNYVPDGTSGVSAELKIWVPRKAGPDRVAIRQVTKRDNGNSFFFRDDEWRSMSPKPKASWIDKGVLFYLYTAPADGGG